jgi:predicted acetyltransferase
METRAGRSVLGAQAFSFRAAADADLDRLVAIHTSAFPDPRGHEPRAKNFRMNKLGALSDLRVAVAERGGEIVAHALVFPLEAWFGGARVKVGGVASVGVAPEARGEGVGGALLAHLHEIARARGDAVSILFAFRQGFYAKHGYAPVTPSRKLRVHPASIPSAWRKLGAGETLRAATGDDRDRIVGAYDEVAARSTGWLARPRALWDAMLLDERREITVLRRGADVAGYVAWTLDQPEYHASIRLTVHELVAKDDAARRALFGCIGAQKDQIAEVEMDVDACDPIDRALTDADRAHNGTAALEHCIGAIASGPMVRVLDVDRAITARGYANAGAIDLAIDGGKLRRVEIARGRASILPSHGGPSLRLDSRALAALLYGALSAIDAARLGWLEGDAGALALATSLFALPPYFTLDAF